MSTNPLRFVLSLVLGVFVAYCVAIFFQSYAPVLFSYDKLDENITRELYTQYLVTLPIRGFVAIIAATALGAFSGGYTAARFNKVRKGDASLGVGIFSFIILVFMSITFDFPWILGLGITIVQVPMAILGGRLASKV